ncbi:MAG: hypothetical protein K2O03_15890, partial [Lachnospiraceae bacterium]|nr:hypothetical protein [Lachnospiraceae bacterium]
MPHRAFQALPFVPYIDRSFRNRYGRSFFCYDTNVADVFLILQPCGIDLMAAALGFHKPMPIQSGIVRMDYLVRTRQNMNAVLTGLGTGNLGNTAKNGELALCFT